jgi:hypothetical protein
MLIDIDDVIIKNNLHTLMSRLSIPPKQKGYRRAIVIRTNDINRLNSIRDPQQRLQFLDSNEFSINNTSLLYCNGDLCEMHNITDSDMIPFITSSVNSNATFWVSVRSDDRDIINQLISQGFTSPFTCRISPFHTNVSDNTICMLKAPGSLSSDFNMTINDVDHVTFQQQDRSTCNITAHFTPDTVEYLREIPMQNGTEIAGAMKISGNQRVGDKVIYDIEVNQNSIVKGENELVQVLNEKYNFHTHPRDAYIRNGVNHAWPSDHDYLGFLKAVFYSNSIFHVVATLEGVYIISIAPAYAGDIHKIKSQQDYIEQVYKIPHSSFKSPQEYIEHVNQLKIFTVVYFSWEDATSQFTVYYPKTNGGCSI